MRPFVFCLLLALIAGPLSAQLTLKVNTIPVNTPPGSAIYAAGTFNNWNPGSASHILTPDGNGHFLLTINPPAGQVKFKFTRGSWATVEGDANGNFLPDRIFQYNGQPTTLDLNILSWEGMGGGGGGTAAPNVQVLDDDFYIPQLNRYRRIWLYLPPDYAAGVKHYPVLYMHDGQNLFDATTSFVGEWEVDESLNALHAAGDYGCIVVGIDHGDQYRFDEYSPWNNPQYGGGQGDAYVEFITNTLKPFIDANYRTLPGRLSTGIMGSSMGGLISMYAFSERQDIFAKAGIFSPAFWFAGNNSANHTATHPTIGPARVYFLAGGQEPASVTQNMQAVNQAMTTAGFTASERQFLTPSDGQHSEWFWRREFPAAYQWLFADAVTHTGAPDANFQWGIYPNPAGDWVRVSGLDDVAGVCLKVIGSDGKIWIDEVHAPSSPVFTGHLPKGYFTVEIATPTGVKRAALLRF